MCGIVNLSQLKIKIAVRRLTDKLFYEADPKENICSLPAGITFKITKSKRMTELRF